MKELSEKHKRFCMEFVKRGNGTRAYMAVYPDSSYEASAVSASLLLKKPNIKNEIKRINGSLMDELGITKASLAERLLGLVDKAEALYRIPDAMKGIELLGREHGMFSTSAKHEVQTTGNVVYTLDMGNDIDEED